jgi:hypothetical protein
MATLLRFRDFVEAHPLHPSHCDDKFYAARADRRAAPASILLCRRGMTIPVPLRSAITVVLAGLSLAVLAPREAFAQG